MALIHPAHIRSQRFGAHAFVLHRRQFEAFTAAERFKVVVAGRRGGKSDAGAWWMIQQARNAHELGFPRAKNIHWVVGPTYKVLRPLWRKIEEYAPRGWITGTKGTAEAPDTIYFGRSAIEFRSASKPESLVAEGLRSLLIDECGTVPEQAWLESLRPMLADFRAPAWLSGTPKGKNWFHRMFLRGQDPLDGEVASFRWHSRANPFVELEEIQAIERTLPRRTVEQEIWAIFLEGAGDVFRTIQENIGWAVKLFGPTGRCTHPTRYLGVDLGQMVDFTVMHGICAQGHTTGFRRFKDTPFPVVKARIVNAVRESENCIAVVDSAGLGKPIVEDLQKALGSRRVMAVNTGSEKLDLIEGHMIAVEQRHVLMPNETVLRGEHEAFTYEYKKRGYISYHAPEGAHDDTVIAAALASWGLSHGPPPLELGVATVS